MPVLPRGKIFGWRWTDEARFGDGKGDPLLNWKGVFEIWVLSSRNVNEIGISGDIRRS